MEIQVRIERLRIEAVDEAGMFLRDVTVAHELAYDRAVLAFGQGVVVGLTRVRFGESRKNCEGLRVAVLRNQS